MDTIRGMCIGISAHQKLDHLQQLVRLLGYESLCVFGDCFDEVGSTASWVWLSTEISLQGVMCHLESSVARPFVQLQHIFTLKMIPATIRPVPEPVPCGTLQVN